MKSREEKVSLKRSELVGLIFSQSVVIPDGALSVYDGQTMTGKRA
jgi:hypothetical protein